MGNKLRILIVEDEFISRILLKEMLTPFGDCDVVTNGCEAVDILAESYNVPGKSYDLVCLDIMMPEMSGHEVLREMRRIERDRGLFGAETVNVFMVSALDDTENIMKAVVDGRCQAYLTKPISRASLEEHMHQHKLIENVS